MEEGQKGGKKEKKKKKDERSLCESGRNRCGRGGQKKGMEGVVQKKQKRGE